MVVDMGAHSGRPPYPFIDDGGHLSCSQRGVGHTWVLVVVENSDMAVGRCSRDVLHHRIHPVGTCSCADMVLKHCC